MRVRRRTSPLLATAAMTMLVITQGCGSAERLADPATIRAGERVFARAGCGTCHTLGAAGSSGRIGPSLDRRRVGSEKVAEQVREGGGGMPAYAGRLRDDEIRAVSAYVAKVAGR
jgi:mono/diheme cytochrome c family protein